MGGGLMQLVAYGAQDIYLTGNPQITFFKVVYRRHTNFAMEAIEQTIQGSAKTGGGYGTVTISRNGDLVHKVYVTSETTGITDGDAIVADVELEIGGQRIDKHYKEWNQTWNELSTPESKATGLKAMKGAIGTSASTGVGMVQVPLNFWFCRNPGLALPLIALQYHEVKLKFTWGAITAVATGASTGATCKVICDYIYLDTDERRRFAQVSHEYLIEQLQRETIKATSTAGTVNQKINFNHPVKELIWTGTTYTKAKLKLNGHDRFSEQNKEYFQLRQPYDHHTSVPKQNLPSASDDGDSLLAGAQPLFRGTFTAFAGTQSLGEGVGVFEAANTPTDNKFSIRTTSLELGTALAPTGETGGINGLKRGDVIKVLVSTANTAGATSGLTVEGVGSAENGNAGVQILLLGQLFIAIVDSVTSTATVTTITLRDGFIRSDGALRITTLIASAAAAVDAKLTFYTSNINVDAARTSKMTDAINVYSFALKPEEHQPSGTCNFSRIDSAQLELTTTAGTAAGTLYAVNYNVLRIMSGMGGLAYSN
jgi:hypothetical protein